MKIARSQLKQIIKEEIETALSEGHDPPWAPEWRTDVPGQEDVVSTEDLFKLMGAGYGPEDLRGLNYSNLTPEMASILGREPADQESGHGSHDWYEDESPYDAGY